MLKTAVFTANEAAAASRVPLKQVHRIIDAGLLAGTVETKRGTRVIGSRGLIALKLAYLTADVLKPEARRRAVLRLLEHPGAPVIRERSITLEVEGIEAELEEGLAELEAAKAMVCANPEIMSGAPCIAGTRIPVHDVADRVANGEPIATLLEDYPALDEGRVGLAVVYAAAYPRRGRPPTPPSRRSASVRSERLRYDDLPPA